MPVAEKTAAPPEVQRGAETPVRSTTSRLSSGVAGLLAPRSVAIVGASDKNNMSHCVFTNLMRHGFPGPVHLVNPNQASVHGRATAPSLASIGEPVDLVFSLVAAPRVPALLEDAAHCGIGNMVVLSGGFAEEGDAGRELQRQVVASAARNGQAVLGPNTIGYLNLHARTVMYGSPLMPPAYPDQLVEPGCVGVAVQSGIVAHTMVRAMLGRRVGLSSVVALGNEAVLGIHHVIEHLVDDPGTSVIALFVETIRDRAAFRAACLRAARCGKPVVALKAGRSAIGAATAVSHTGALAGNEAVNRAAFRQLGIIAVQSIEELVVTTAFIAGHGVPQGRRAAFMAVSGGFCEMFADRAEEVGLEVPPLASTTLDKLRAILPASAMVGNPLDTTGIAQTDATIFPRAIEILGQDPNIDVVFVGRNVWRGEPQDDTALMARFKPWGDAIARSPLPVAMVSDMLTECTAYEQRFSRAAGLLPEIGGLTHGLHAFVSAQQWHEQLPRVLAAADAAQALPSAGRGAVPIPASGRPVSEHQVLALLESAGVPVVPFAHAGTWADGVVAARSLGFPVVLKISSPDIAHKSAMGGVVLNIADEDGVREAWTRVIAAGRAQPGAPLVDGVLLMPMRPPGLELIVGVKRDPNWGLALVVGIGGVWAEMLQDTAVMPLPVTAADVRHMLASLRGAPLLRGGHGLPPVDMDRAVEAIVRVAWLALQLGDSLESIEINPLRASGARVEALDGLLIWRAAEVPGAGAETAPQPPA